MGATQQFTATGTYSDGSTQNLSNRVTWTSSNTAVATINTNGLATGVSAGTATISATLGSVSGNATLTVRAPLAILTSANAVIVPEGGTTNFQVKLNTEPISPTTVTVSWVSGDTNLSVQSGRSLVFDAADWNIDQTVTLSAAADPDRINGSALIQCSAPELAAKDVTATEEDNTPPLTILTSANAVTVPEGGTTNFLVKLNTEPINSTTVTVSWVSGDTNLSVQSGRSLVFDAADWNIDQTVTLAAAADPDRINGSALIQCSAPELAAKDVTATEEDNTPGLAILTSANAVIVPEGGTTNFLVKLNTEPISPTTVTVSWVSGDTNLSVQSGRSLVFDAADWNIDQTVTLAAAADPDRINGSALIQCSAPELAAKDVTATEEDNTPGLAILTSANAVIVPEGGTTNFLVKLNTEPISPTTVTVSWASGDTNLSVQSGRSLVFDAADWNIDQTVTLAAASDPDRINGSALIQCSAPELAAKDVTATEEDNTPPLTILTSANAVTVPEGGTTNFLVKLNTEPINPTTVTVSWASGDTNLSVQSGRSLVFDAADWNVDQTVTLAAASDPDRINSSALIQCSAPELAAKDVTATEEDNTPGLAILTSANAVSVPEGGTTNFLVKLNTEPINPTTVTVSWVSGDTNLSAQSGRSLVFDAADWNIDQTVTLAAAADPDRINGSALIQCSSPELAAKDVTATEEDNTPGLAILTSANAVTVPEGGTTNFLVKLNTEPINPTTVTVSWVSGDTNLSVQSGRSLIFDAADWNIDQTVTLAAASDPDRINGLALIQCSAPELASKDVTATEEDNTPGLAILTSANAVTVPEGGTTNFLVKLNTEPISPTTVTVSWVSGDTNLSVQSGNSLVFKAADWNIDQTVTLAAAADPDRINGSALIQCSSPELAAKDVTATEEDNTPGLAILTSANAVSVPEGGTTNFLVKLNTEPISPTTVTVSWVSGDTNLSVQSGRSLIFDAADWNIDQTVTLAAAADPDRINGSALIQCSSPELAAKDVTATEEDNTPGLAILTSTNAVTVPEGGTTNFLVKLNTEPINPTTVTVSRVSGDTNLSVQSGSSLVFDAADWNIDQTVTLAAAADPDRINGSALIQCSAPELAAKDVTATEEDNTPGLAILTSTNAVSVPEGGTTNFQVKLNTEPINPTTVTVSWVSGDTNLSVQSGTFAGVQSRRLEHRSDSDAVGGGRSGSNQRFGAHPMQRARAGRQGRDSDGRG